MKKDVKVLCVCILIVTFGVVPSLVSAASQVFDVDREFYPYYPSLIKWNKSTVAFTPPEVCAGCHHEKYEEWTGSVHALAFHDPVYQGELNKGFKAVGHDVTRQCEGCHSPAGMVTGEVKGPGIEGLSTMALAGVSCDICHSISGTTHWQTPSHEPENGSFILTPGIDTEDGPKLIKRGPIKPYDGCGMGFHECNESSLHLQADLCAGCHQVYHYSDHFPLEATYLEWKHGAYAQRGVLCQDCHMVDITTFLRTADTFQKPALKEYKHYFNGANYLLYYLAAGAARKAGDEKRAAIIQEKYEMAVKRLQSAADIELFPVYHDGILAEIKVRIKNIRAGHNLPTSLTNVRQMWLELTATDEKGTMFLTSGTIDAEGHLPEDTRLFNSDGMGKDFHFAIDPWVVTAFSRHDTIPPKGYKDVYYGIRLPKDAQKVIITAKLRYRQADQGVARKLLGAVPESIDLEKIYGLTEVPILPVVDMVVQETTIFTGR
jgi:hypothetical protein